MRYLVATLALGSIALLQVSLFSRFSLLGASPHLVLLAIIAWSLMRGPGEGMFWGFIGGLLYDLASGGPIGISAASMVIAAALSGLSGRTMFSSNILQPVLTVFVVSIVYFVIVAFLLATLHHPTDWKAVLAIVAVPTAAANAALGLLIYPLFAFVNSHTHGQVRVEF